TDTEVLGGIDEQPAEDLLVHLGDAPRRLEQSFAAGVVTDRADQVGHGGTDTGGINALGLGHKAPSCMELQCRGGAPIVAAAVSPRQRRLRRMTRITETSCVATDREPTIARFREGCPSGPRRQEATMT